ncbi:DNA cytosine methyltransferase [Streptococcus equinus]|uniref:DNA cytosine methyltransferase n=1 Tax=Streptococcus equinus TaxID=1335 RepID=UPI0008F0A128|nr:DNA cytosine methyltransferase [Streptococcus equinus]SFQ64110.1 DNA (cytosine-5)-methyltransferase 1 [Streptococcus equinus]
MGELISYFSNNVFDLNILSKKEFVEMVENFTKTSLMLGYKTTKKISLESLINELKRIGIVTDNQDFKLVQSILNDKLLEDLFGVVAFLSEVDKSGDMYLSKYYYERRKLLVKKENESRKPTVVDLFCGSGGLSLGFSQNKFKIIFANDIEKSALRTYSFNHPEVDGNKITMGGIEDIAHNVNSYINEDVDVLAGGPPCQGFSNANRQRIIDDPRNVLYKYYVETVKNLHPKFFVMENVKGMKSVAKQVIEDFNSSINVKYDITFTIFNAKEFGVPQNRERLIYIGVRQDIADKFSISANKIIREIDSQSQHTTRVLSDALINLKALEASREKNSTEKDTKKSGRKIDILDCNINSGYLEDINQQREMSLIFNHKARYNNDRDIEIYSRMLPGDKSDSERIADIMPYKNRSHMFKDKYYKLIPNQPCKTITAHMKFDCNMYIHPYEARGLTPREAARVQSYPDDYFFLGAFTKTYMQIGNSVPPLLSRSIAKVIKKYL